MNARTLVLAPWYFPHTVIGWKHAVMLYCLGKVEVVESYTSEVGSPSTSIKTPAVVRLLEKISTTKRGVKFSRINVYLRDNFTCGHCGHKLPMSQLTYDHVLPRARGGLTRWDNIVTACYVCNAKKGARTPVDSGMQPNREPFQPLSLPLHPPLIDVRSAPAEWRDDYDALPQAVAT